jgi:hypothetical protein
LEVISASNDDGVDAVVLLKRRRGLSPYAGPTGDLLFVQIKTGYIDAIPKADYALSFDAGKMDGWRQRWAAYPGPAVMIHVVPRRITTVESGVEAAPIAYWSDLKRAPGASPQKVSFKYKNRFDASAKSSFYNLCWRWAEFRKLPVIEVDQKTSPSFGGEPLAYYLGETPLLTVARNYFKAWKEAAAKNPVLFQASVTWRGWEHITRLKRPMLTKQQSLLLLPAASRLLLTANNIQPTVVQPWNALPAPRRPNGQVRERRYEALTARIISRERQEAVVRVVLERTRTTSPNGSIRETTTFYSVYEVARRRRTL